MEKCNCNNKEDVLRIVRGNAFSINIHVEAVRLDGTVVEDFHLIDAEATLRIIHAGNKTEREFIVEENNATVSFSDGDGCGWYGMEMTGTYNGQPWRWCVENVFQIVETNERANVPSWTFLADNQYFMTGVMTLISGDRQQADWAETNPNSLAYIKNKPDVVTHEKYDPTIRAINKAISDEEERAKVAEKANADAIDAEKERAEAAEKQNADDIADIEGLIPAQASTNNPLADKNYVDGKEDKSNKVTSLSAESTDTQYPSAKCVYDLYKQNAGDIADVEEAGLYFVDSAGYIGVKIDNGGLHAINLPTFNNY